MKIILRTLIILLAAAIVGGIIFALAGSNTSGAPSGFEGYGGAEFHPGDNAGARPGENGNFPNRAERERGEFGGSFLLPEGMIKG